MMCEYRWFWAAGFVALSVALGCSGPERAASEQDAGEEAPVAAQAQARTPDETVALVSKELQRILQSAARAGQARDWVEARQLAIRGIELAQECGHKCELDKAKFFLIRGNAEREKGLENEARRYYADAMALFHVHKFAQGRFETFLSLGQLEARLGDYSAAARQLDQAKELLSEVQDKNLIGQLNVQTGRLSARQQQREKALASFQEAVRIFEVTNDKSQLAETLLLVATEEDALSKNQACLNALNRALRLFQDMEDLDGEVRVVHRLAALAEREKKYTKAKQLLKRALELYKKLDRNSTATKVERHINALPD